MSNPMHQEIFEFYGLNAVPGINGTGTEEEKVKRAIRKTINKYYKNLYPTKEWSELTDVERNDFKLITIREYIFEKIKYPRPEEKGRTIGSKTQKIIDDLKLKIDHELLTMHKSLKIMEEHNKTIDILYKQFYSESATEKENHNAYQEFCEHLVKFLPQLEPPSFEEWLKNPLTIYEIREEAILEYQRHHDHEDLFSYKPSKLDVLEEIIACLLKELNISIDVDGIKHCLTAASYIDTFNYENIENTPVNKDIIDSYIRLQEHNFIIKE